MDLFHLAYDKDQWPVFVNTIMKFHFLIYGGEFLE
jgi:hypothetical protein